MFCFSQKYYWLSGLVGSIAFKDTFFPVEVNDNAAVYSGGGAAVAFHEVF